MEWVDQLRGHVVGLDTAPLIYFIEEHPKYLDLVKPFFESLDRGEFQVVTSTVTLLEVLAQPFRQNNSRLAQQYRDILLHANHITTTWLTPDIAERAAQLRAQYAIATPDAIQIATALHTGATHFFTNDKGIPNLPGLNILVLDQLHPN